MPASIAHEPPVFIGQQLEEIALNKAIPASDNQSGVVLGYLLSEHDEKIRQLCPADMDLVAIRAGLCRYFGNGADIPAQML